MSEFDKNEARVAEAATLPAVRVGRDSEGRTGKRSRLRRRILRVMLLLAFIELPLALGLDRGGYYFTKQIATEEQSLEAEIGNARWAQRIFTLESAIPLWGRQAAARRAELANALGVDQGIMRGFGGTFNFEARRAIFTDLLLSMNNDADEFEEVRYELESWLLKWGGEREIVSLESRLPATGLVEQRVLAHWLLGDLEGAERLALQWEHPSSDLSSMAKRLRRSMQCATGQHLGRKEVADILRNDMSGFWRLGKVDCLLGGGAEEQLLAFLAASGHPIDSIGEDVKLYIKLWGALDTQNAPLAQKLVDENPGVFEFPLDDLGLLVAVVLARNHRLNSTWSKSGSLLHRLGYYRQESSIMAGNSVPSMFAGSLFWALRDARLQEVATALEAEALGEHAEEMRLAAGRIYLRLSFDLGRRWDPRTDSLISKAVRLAPNLEPNAERLRELFAALHDEKRGAGQKGDFEVWIKSGKMTRALRAEKNPHRDESLYFKLRSSLYRFPENYALFEELIRSERSTEDKMSLLNLHGPLFSVSTQFERLTRVIVFGSRLGVDVSIWEKQIVDLRALMDAHPQALEFSAWL